MLLPRLLVELQELLIVDRPGCRLGSLILLPGTVVEHGLRPSAHIANVPVAMGHDWLQMPRLCFSRRVLAPPSEVLILLVVVVGMLRPRELLRASLAPI